MANKEVDNIEGLCVEGFDVEGRFQRLAQECDQKLDLLSQSQATEGKQLVKDLKDLEKEEQRIWKDLAKKKDELLAQRVGLRKELLDTQQKLWEKKSDTPENRVKLQKMRSLLASTTERILFGSVNTSEDDLVFEDSVEVPGQILELKKWEIDAKELVIYPDQRLGKGQYGEVYKGKYQESDVAVKKLLEQTLDKQTLEEFVREVKVMASLRHPNILLLMGACTKPGMLCMVMEWMPYGSVDKLIHAKPGASNPDEENTELSLRKKLMIAKGVAQGMNWLHSLPTPILHLDLKPGNLLLDENYNVKISDFGMSQMKHQHQGIAGSPLYMAPEMLMGKSYDTKADVYSFGVLVWELLTQQFPYDREFATFDQLRTGVLANRRPRIPDSVPTTLRTMMTGCWQHDAKQRPTFKTILNSKVFDEVVLEGLFDDANKNMRTFWSESFFGRWSVSWKVFQQAYRKYSKLPSLPDARAGAGVAGTTVTDPEQKLLELKMACMQVMLGAQSPSQVTVEQFSNLLKWFGPATSGVDLLEKVYGLAAKPWFHAAISKKQAEDLLFRSQHKGAFVVRFSATSPGSFTISCINEAKAINHFKVLHTPGTGYKLGDVEYPSLEVLVRTEKKLPPPVYIRLKNACENSPFAGLFAAYNTNMAREETYTTIASEKK